MLKYSLQSLESAAIKALENARKYLADAVRLAHNGASYGHAIGLLILGREETQKALLLTYCGSGVYDISEKRVQKELDKALRQHEYRHDSAWYTHILAAYIMFGSKLDDEKGQQYIDWLKKTGSPKGGRLEKLKWRGLYVDIDSQGRVLHPNDVTKDEFEDLLALSTELMALVGFLCNFLIGQNTMVTPFKHQADQYRLLAEIKPMTLNKVNELESSGKINSWMAGFGRFLIRYGLEL